jgi:hypothetical protein
LGIGDWGLGPIPNPQSPIPNSQSPFLFELSLISLNIIKILNIMKLISIMEKILFY